jgi:hypothetical protein
MMIYKQNSAPHKVITTYHMIIRSILPSYTQGIQDDNRITRSAQNTMGNIWVELRAHHPHGANAHTPLVTFKLSVGPDHVEVINIKVKERGPIKVSKVRSDRVKHNLCNRIVSRLGSGSGATCARQDQNEVVYVIVCTTTDFRVGDLHINSGTWRVRMRCSPGYRWVSLDGDVDDIDEVEPDVSLSDSDDVEAKVSDFLRCIGIDDYRNST